MRQGKPLARRTERSNSLKFSIVHDYLEYFRSKLSEDKTEIAESQFSIRRLLAAATIILAYSILVMTQTELTNHSVQTNLEDGIKQLKEIQLPYASDFSLRGMVVFESASAKLNTKFLPYTIPSAGPREISVTNDYVNSKERMIVFYEESNTRTCWALGEVFSTKFEMWQPPKPPALYYAKFRTSTCSWNNTMTFSADSASWHRTWPLGWN